MNHNRFFLYLKITMNYSQLKEFLDFKVNQYNTISFIETDPISVPHFFSKKEDIEIAGFLTAILSWGNRTAIRKAASSLMELFQNEPFEFILNMGTAELKKLEKFYYRTFQPSDAVFFAQALSNIYLNHGGLENVFTEGYRINKCAFEAIEHCRKVFFQIPHQKRYTKHFSSPAAGSAAKRLNMFLRWMVRKDNKGVDFGIWSSISPSDLICPLDLHSGRVARKLGLLNRKQNDRKAAKELTEKLKNFDSLDPVKYDFALFGLGVFEKF